MNVWAISDLHLSFGRPEPRHRFAERWRDHAASIERGWRAVVRPGDVVLLPGDLSMARNHRELQPDLEWLGALPGTKVLAPGNHDRWWNTTDAVRRLLRRSMVAVGGDAAEVQGLIVCGTRGAPVPADDHPTDADQIAAERELALLDRALEQAAGLREVSGLPRPIYVLWHFPPFDSGGRPGPCAERLERARVAACVYGHLHIEAQWSLSVQGVVRGVRYHCVAADAVGFQPLRIGSLPHASHPRR